MGDELFKVTLGQLELVLRQDALYCTVELDSTGRAWLGVRGQPTLWVYDPSDGD